MNLQRAGDPYEVIKVRRLDEKGIRAQFVSTIYLAGISQDAKHNGVEPAQMALLADPLQNLEAVFARHFQIQKQQAR